MSRIFAISDLHTDYEANMEFVESLPPHPEDVLIVAGDVSDDIPRLIETLSILKAKYKDVYFIPGNHELWINKSDISPNSLVKLFEIVRHCTVIGVQTEPGKVRCLDGNDVWIVPLYSWYAGPDDDPKNTLYIPEWPALKRRASGSCPSLAQLFADMNTERLTNDYDAPVITFSHFVPRPELMRASIQDESEIALERNIMGLPSPDWKEKEFGTRFNFSRVAGSNILDRQLRKIGSMIHVYGHQHRNRDRTIRRVRYVSHCLGNPREHGEGITWGISTWAGPKLIHGHC
ncbi:uncharacterized protein LOC134810941 [Bolinopsis microptera]|uniref:uncharacterized protein LOC134810941 n=1 Tax=Bolinopsis microptera TaxID=2820187 RepID=UPI003078E04E